MRQRLFSYMGAAVLSVGAVSVACSSTGSGGGSSTGGTPGSFTGGSGGQSTGGTANAGGAAGSGAGAGGVSGDGGGSGSGGSTSNPGGPGSPCTADTDCVDPGATCITDGQGWPNGYCTVEGCQSGSCPAGAECFQTTTNETLCLQTCTDKADCHPGYACHSVGACVPACTSDGDCDAGEVCNPGTGLCGDAPCTPGSCAAGLTCDTASGMCIPDAGSGPGPGPGPDCTGKLPTRDCTGTSAYCGELMQFDPDLGPGYEDYPINGETQSNQYRSYARRDMQMLIKYAAAYVECKAASWNTGNGGLVGLGDMSESNGAIPGTSIGQPGHPEGTHVNGFDMDIGYFQAGTVDNKLRPICEHTSGGEDQYHCVSAPNKLDLWRTTLFLGALFSSETVRVIGVDGQVGSLVEAAMPSLCATGWLQQRSCDSMTGKFSSQKQYGLAYEVTDGGAGWYYFHHHHLHISLNGKIPTNPTALPPDFGLGGSLQSHAAAPASFLEFAGVPGHGAVAPAARKLNAKLPGIH